MKEVIKEKQLESLRNKAKKLTYIVYILSAVSLPLYMWLFYIVMRQEEEILTLFAVIKLVFVAVVLSIATLGLLWYVIVRHAYDHFNESFKSKYVVQTINKISGFDKLQYVCESGFLWDEVRNAAVVACGDKKYYESEDLLFGEYENVRFKISDVTTKKIVRRNKKSRIEEIFSGQIICLLQFDNTKVSKGHLQIFEKEFLSDMSGWKAEHKIHTENETFNSRFRIYADDAHNAYYILTPQRMEKIMSFADAVQYQVSLVFCDEKLFVAVKRESMFDAVVDEPISKQIEKIIEDAKLIQKAKEILIMS